MEGIAFVGNDACAHNLLLKGRPGRATIYTIASTGAMLLYRAETRQRRYAALAAESRCASDFNSHQTAWHSSHTLLIQFLSHTTTPTGWPLLLSSKWLT